MMQYSKGDTIKLYNGAICLVLDNGIRGTEFCRVHNKERINLYSQELGRAIDYVVTIDSSHSIVNPAREYVFYNILIGDIKGWTTEMTLDRLEKYDVQ